MDLGALQERASSDIKKFEAKVGEKDFDEILFLYLSRITEEIGNLSAAVLSKEGIKTEENINNTELPRVFADSIYSIILLAQKMNINLDKAMDEKIKRIEEENEEAAI